MMSRRDKTAEPGCHFGLNFKDQNEHDCIESGHLGFENTNNTYATY